MKAPPTSPDCFLGDSKYLLDGKVYKTEEALLYLQRQEYTEEEAIQYVDLLIDDFFESLFPLQR
jgi:hypothetical protein